MTPEERAEKLLSNLLPGQHYSIGELRNDVAQVIREAVAAERERCAGIARRIEDSGNAHLMTKPDDFGEVCYFNGRSKTAKEINERILNDHN